MIRSDGASTIRGYGLLGGSILPGAGLVPVPEAEPDPILWLLANEGVTGTGAEVDTWATRSTSGVTLSEAGTGKPIVVGTRVSMENSAGDEGRYFTGGSTSTFQAVTETGVFNLAWRGTIDAYDADVFGATCYLVATKSTSRGFALLTASTGRLTFSAWNISNVALWRLDYADFVADYTLGDPLDIVVIGDGTTARMYVDGVEVASDTITTQAGAHQSAPLFGKSLNSTVYHYGGVDGIFYDAVNDYTVEELRGYVTP